MSATCADPKETERAASVSFVCDDCGRVHNRNNPPCNDCGSMQLTAAENVTNPATEIDETESWRIVRDANREITGMGVFVTIVGTVTLLAGVSLLGVFGLYLGWLLTRGWIIGFTLTGAGLLAIPAVRRRIEDRLEIYPSSRAVLGLYLTLVIGCIAAAYL